jgi:Rrf2 family cysteine metabolism transcriptional repressor
MRLSKAARHALLAATEMARSKDNGPVTVTLVARRNGIPEAALAKVLQRLVRSGLAVGVRGVHGGYRLSRPPSEITVLDVLDVFEPSAHPVGATSRLGAGAPDHVGQLFDSVDEQLRSTFASLTLDVLARNEGSPSTTVRPSR